MTPLNSNSAPEIGSIHRSICGTEYIVTGSFNPVATETADEKITRLILMKAGTSSIMEVPISFVAAQKEGVQNE